MGQGHRPLPGSARPIDQAAIYNASGLSYLRHTDWLGSSRFATTWNHAVYSKTSYAPFGETYNESGTADRSFTGQDQDVITGSGATGVYDFLYRKHDPSAGRWLSPDPSGWAAVDFTNPQSLNRYAYVMNSPLSLTDELGLCPQLYAQYHYPGTGNLWYFTGVSYLGDDGIPCVPKPGCTLRTNAEQTQFTGEFCQGTPGNIAAGSQTWSYGGGSQSASIRITKTQYQCLKAAKAKYITAIDRSNEDFWRGVKQGTWGGLISGAIGGCAAGAIPTGGIGCPLGGAVGGLGGVIGGAIVGTLAGIENANVAVIRAGEDLQADAAGCAAQ